MIKFCKQKNKGFTLVETLIAISIFTTSVLTLIVMLSQGIADTSYAKKKIIAGYLAQEGIEYVRNMRDTFVLYSATGQAGWTAFNNKLNGASCASGNGCYFDDAGIFSGAAMPITQTLFTACGASCPLLLYDSSTGKYNYILGMGSGFIRKIQINLISGAETKISSTVFWNQGSGTYNITLSENLLNWTE
jgi:Tfp pilus assembly protein PilV